MAFLDIISSYWQAIAANFTDLANRTSWIFLLTALVGALISYFLYAKESFTLRRFAAYALPKKSFTHDSAKMDYFLFLLRPMWWGILLVPFVIQIDAYAKGMTYALNYLFGAREAVEITFWHKTIYTIGFIIAFDFGQFFTHYLSHRYWFFWEFHKVHHSAEVLNPLTALRFHPVDDLVATLVIGFFGGIAKGFFLWLWGSSLTIWQVVGIDLGLFLFYFAAYNLRHSQVWLAYPYWISHVFQSRQHWDKNIGFIFSIWDVMFGTLYVPKQKEDLEYGLGGGQDTPFHSPTQVYTLPFKNIYRQLRSGKPAPEMALVKDVRLRREKKKTERAAEIKTDETKMPQGEQS